MAEETISTRIVANADFSALIADVHKVTASLSKLQEQLANSNKMLANQIAVMNQILCGYIKKHWSILNTLCKPTVRCRKVW
jgi:hypothetical protein